MEKKLPKGWKLISLKELFNLYYGKGLPTSELKEEGFNVYGANGIIGKYDRYLFENSMVIISCRGAASGAIHKTRPKSFVTSNSIILDIISQETIDLDYARYGMILVDKSSVITGTAQPQITIQLLQYLQLPLAPLLKQQRIVAKLDALFGHLDGLKEKLNRIPELLKNFRQQVLTQAVTGELTREWREGKGLGEWEETTFGNLMDGTPKNGAYFPKTLYGSGIRIIRIDAFYDGVLNDWSKLQKVRISENELEQYNIQIGDILVNRVNSMDYLGKCMLVDYLPEPFIYESNMMRVRLLKDKISSEFARVFLTSSIGLRELRKNAKQAVNQASINQKDVMQVEISIPNSIEQTEIVKRVDVLFKLADKIESQYQSLKIKIDQLPQAILNKAFRGELVGQEVNEYVREAGEVMMAAATVKEWPS